MSMQNPFWTVNRNLFQTRKDRFILGGSLSYDVTDWFNVQARVRTDSNNAIAEQKHHASSNGLFAGSTAVITMTTRRPCRPMPTSC
jgi:hypothetical protein